MKSLIFFTLLSFTLASWSQDIVSKVTICWDKSSSMEDRDLKKDFSVLENYFNKSKKIEVQLLLFDIEVREKSFTVLKGGWDDIRLELLNVKYDGATVFSDLKEKIKYKDVFVFTDGKRLTENDMILLPPKSIIVNNSVERDVQFLERAALLNSSRLIDIMPTLNDTVKHDSTSVDQNKLGKLKGTVFINNKPSSNTIVTVKGKSESFTTDADGIFSVLAEVGDTLLITNRNNRTLKLIPVEFLSYMKVFLESDIISLDEVTVVEERQQQERLNNGYSTYTKDQLGYEIATIETDEITAIETTPGDVVRNKVSGVDVSTKNSSGVEGGIAQTEIRGRNSINMNANALVVVDGIPINRSGSELDLSTVMYERNIANFNFIDPGNIKKVTVLKGLAATNQWGSAGANGVILITTKTGGATSSQKSIRVDKARLKNNIYDENTELTGPVSSYLKAFEKSKSLEDAYEVYQTLKDINPENNMLYLDAFSYFKSKDKNMASCVISNLWESDPKNIDVLKLLSLAYTSIEDYNLASIINNEIISINPKVVNTHLNQALLLKNQNKPKESLTALLELLNGNSNYGINTSGIYKTLNREVRNLVFTSKDNLHGMDIATKYQNNVTYKVRLVFEWNHPGAEFELQFVNPQNRYYNWKHTNDDNKERIKDEIENEYSLEEFEFSGDNVNGKWIVNALSLQDFKSNNTLPLVLKTTIYKDYGSSLQSKEQVFVHFTKFNEKKNLININVD
ncbi:tetratricopeptide repeat protein [Maribacter arcticus]|uniref:TonB-dependent outer membrane receptor, SusC/RagA subfamily, signature region n=1 Tax=Maribacter arcticus TaxID=561365 RepID=A0A1T5BE70_9FLAO|nr:tetratricopeptide repeat protein [Maribacter arcticus]SKB45582.1 TonB-dependent outer membrane receptor, SusC/RagA subfamily, signature region [Maribacter arcticus]